MLMFDFPNRLDVFGEILPNRFFGQIRPLRVMLPVNHREGVAVFDSGLQIGKLIDD
jgi:hypothetical protein